MTNKKLTNRQAIGVLDELWPNPLFGEAHRQAFEIGIKAIKALEQEPCEDCVSRQAVLDIINFEDKWLLDAKGHNADTEIAFDGIKSRIAKFPPVNPQPKTGHWVEYTRVLIPEPINKWEQAWYCSECGYGNQDSDESAWLEWNYCPNCGAKMIEPQERSE